MGLNLTIANPITYPDWDGLILDNKDYSFFHSSLWARILNETYKYTPLYFIKKENKSIKTLVPLMVVRSWLTGTRAVSLPFSDFCPLFFESDPPLQPTIDYILQYGLQNNWKYLEFRSGCLPNNEISSASFYEHELFLDKNETDIFSSLSNSTKRNIKLAKNKEVKTRISNSEIELDQYYKLHCETRRRLGVPPQPIKFFKNIYKYIINKKEGFIIIASYKGQDVAGMIFLQFGKKAYWKFAASDYQFRKIKANNLLLWESIKWHLQNGYEKINFGRTELDHDGLRNFKLGWNAVEKNQKYYRYDFGLKKFVGETNEIHKNFDAIVRKSPIIFLRSIGKIIYKHIG